MWDPITGHECRVPFLPGFPNSQHRIVLSGAVLCAAGDDHGHVHGDCSLRPLKLVLLSTGDDGTSVFACLYESESGVWGNIISTAIPQAIDWMRPSVLVGNALCWLLYGGTILVFNFARQNFVVTEKPAAARITITPDTRFQILRTDDSGLDLAMFAGRRIEIWERKANSNGVDRWVLQKTVELDKLLPLGSSRDGRLFLVFGFDEDTNVISLATVIGVFMVQLESMEFTNIGKRDSGTYYPYTNFYPAGNAPALHWISNIANPVTFGRGIGDGNGVQMLNNT